MTPQEAIEMLTAKAECIRREASGIDVDCIHRNCDECDLCYKQGTMGDQMEALGVAISALQAQEETVSRKVYEQISWERDIAVMQLKDLGYSLGEKIRTDGDLISRADAIDAAMEYGKKIPTYAIRVKNAIEQLPSVQPESTRTFVKLVVKYPDPELCTYKEYKGKPYYSIKYIENGETYVGYGTYNPKVLSQFLKEYFISSAQSEIIRCEDCEHLQKWRSEESAKKFGQIYECARGVFACPKPEDFCSHAERRTDDGE